MLSQYTCQFRIPTLTDYCLCSILVLVLLSFWLPMATNPASFTDRAHTYLLTGPFVVPVPVQAFTVPFLYVCVLFPVQSVLDSHTIVFIMEFEH